MHDLYHFFYTVTADPQRYVEVLEVRCNRKIMNISYSDHITNEDIGKRIIAAFESHDNLVNIMKKRKMM